MNKWIGTGRLTNDPELRHTQSGKSVCSFTIATDRQIKTEGLPTADFFNCVAWNKTGEFISQWFQKGKMIAIDGRLQNRNWDDNDGKKHYATEIIIDNAEFCGDKGYSKQTEDTNKQRTSPETGYKTPVSGKDFQELEDDDGDLPF